MTPLVAAKVLARNACTGASATASLNSPSLRFWDAQSVISTRDSHSSRSASKSLKTNGRPSFYPERPGASKSDRFADTKSQFSPLSVEPVILRTNGPISAPSPRAARKSGGVVRTKNLGADRRGPAMPSLHGGVASAETSDLTLLLAPPQFSRPRVFHTFAGGYNL